MTELIVGLIVGLLVGLVVAYVVSRQRRAEREELKNAFAGLSQEALRANAEEVVRLGREVLAAQTDAARKDLEADKKLIDQNLDAMAKRLVELQAFVQKADKDREGSHKALAAQLQSAAQETLRLRQTTDQLNTALASPQHRGQWGERMAEDVLRLAGFDENINYYKQQKTEAGTRPDFTFPLPNDLRLNMDVKFPLSNYLRYLEAKSDEERQRYADAFISDVSTRVREAATREYINPAENTVDYALVFIPNEQVYASIYELRPELIDEALRRKVVLCSPLTLYAVLAVIRQAAQNIAAQRSAGEMADLISAFLKQWAAFKDELVKLGRQLETARKTYDEVSGTRTRQLEKPVEEIERLRSAQPELKAGPRTALPHQEDAR